MRSISGAASSLMSTLILVSHASFAPFVPNARIISFLSGHAIKISQQSHSYTPNTACFLTGEWAWGPLAYNHQFWAG